MPNKPFLHRFGYSVNKGFEFFGSSELGIFEPSEVQILISVF